MTQRKPPGTRTSRGTETRQRQHQVKVRLSDEEKAAVDAAAARTGESASSVLRYAFLASQRPKGPGHQHRVRLLGQRVRITLDRARNEPPVVSEGILLGFGDDGTAEVEEDDGFIHYCWPMLDVEPAPDLPAKEGNGDASTD